jgi:hypothetical protein
MRITISIVIFCAAIFLSGCASGISRTGYRLAGNQDSKAMPRCPIALQSNIQYDKTSTLVLGSIHAYDTAFSVTCDEAYVLDIFCKEGCLLGADVVNITEEKQPDLWSSCYRAKAEFLRFKDRNQVSNLRSDPKYAPNLIIARSVKANQRTEELITAEVLGGILGGIVVWEATK